MTDVSVVVQNKPVRVARMAVSKRVKRLIYTQDVIIVNGLYEIDMVDGGVYWTLYSCRKGDFPQWIFKVRDVLLNRNY